MKKIMLLGGSRYLLPVIKAVHELGHHAITCDYLPDNIAHRYSDEYHNVSIIEKDAVLDLARTLDIDGIMSFACDPGVVTAAYVAEKMGLPFQGSYESTSILQDKGRFRKFLSEHHFNVPRAQRYTEKEHAFHDIEFFKWPVIVKPVDSAGSKGVTRVDSVDGLSKAIDGAIDCSHCGAFIIEEFITFKGYHSSTDPFTVNGELKFISYSDQLFDPEADNPYTPSLIIWPSTMDDVHQSELTKEIQRLMNLLDMGTGIYNIESCVGMDGKPYIMEVSPRGGGCKIAELQQLAYGQPFIENEVRKAVGMPLLPMEQTDCVGCWCEMVVHARPGQSGRLKSVNIAQDVNERYVKLVDLAVKKGSIVRPFTGANMALGDMFLRFDDRDELNAVIARSKDWLKIELE